MLEIPSGQDRPVMPTKVANQSSLTCGTGHHTKKKFEALAVDKPKVLI